MSLSAGDVLERLWPVLLIVVAGAASLAAQLWVFPADVEPEDWKRPAVYVRERIESDDIVRVHPSWTADPLPHLTEIGERVRRQHFPLAEDLQGVERVWLLSETDRLQEAYGRLPFRSTSSNTSTKAFPESGVTVARLEVPDSTQFPYEMLEHLDEATVQRVKGQGRVQTCNNWNEADWRWDCGARDPWLYVGRELLVLDDDFHRCIWAHPPPKGRTLRVTFPDVPLSKTLRVRAGLDFRASLSQRGTDVEFRVRLGDEVAVEHTYGAETSTWFPHDIDTKDRSGTKTDVTIEVRSKKVQDRYFCFNGWVLE